MILSSADVEQGATLHADVVIVGAGAAGIAIAHQLRGSRLDVILLESGGREFDDAVQDLHRGTIAGQPTEDLDVSRLRYFGGTTNHWAGWCRPLDREDFETRPDWPESGWPITRRELDPYYKIACELCQLGPTSFDRLDAWRDRPGGERLSALEFDRVDRPKLRTALFQISPPTRFGEVYEPALQEAVNIRTILNANVLDLLPAKGSEPGSSRKAVAGVTAASAPGRTFTVLGRAVVVAVGGIEAPRLLLSATQVYETGAGNEHGLVGRYFMDHPWVRDAAYWRFTSQNSDWPLYFDQTEIAGARLFGTLCPDRAWSHDQQIGAFRLLLEGSRISTAGNDAIREILGALKRGKLPADLGDHLASIMDDIDVVADSAYRSGTGSRDSPFLSRPDANAPYKGASVDLNFEQRPNPASRVVLNDDRDSFGMRRVSLDWRLGATDRLTAGRALSAFAQLIGAAALGRVRLKWDPADEEAWSDAVTGSRHHMGTARMSASPTTGVVDRDCRVHSVDNLFVAGSAVFATSGYANPTLTVVALAARLAGHLEARLR